MARLLPQGTLRAASATARVGGCQPATLTSTWKGRTSLLLIFAIGSVLSGCDNPSPNMAFSVDEHGQLQMLYKPCHADARVFSVRLSAGKEQVWSITSERGSMLREFTVGQVPDGFTESMPLASPDPDLRLVATVSTSELQNDSEGFERADLRSDQVLAPQQGLMTRSKFLKSDTCG